jgi:hypothetical protein
MIVKTEQETKDYSLWYLGFDISLIWNKYQTVDVKKEVKDAKNK